MTINWSLGNITDSISGLDSNPIMLEYFDGSTYNTIASNLSNDGTYSWSSIASIDTNIAIIRITATDNAGNTSYQNSDSFTIDSTNPSISSIETLEHNISNGSINALKVVFSEDINDSSISYSDFSIDGGSITPTGISTG
ncbi:MAG: hypothetical protein GY827_03335 [Cytophagales bacterium]|nr:hypothetical protein [Cytophagales bacterium]